MPQLPLFEETGTSSRRQPLDAVSEWLLQEYGQKRASQGASQQSVRREMSQLRSIARECGGPGVALPLETAFNDVAQVARVLREPTMPISRATGRARLVAAQRFIQNMGPVFGRNPETDLASLDALLPACRSTGWHTVGTMVAGDHGRRRTRGPTLDAADLRRIVDAAGDDTGGAREVRDRALAAILCFSGVRIEEALNLVWEDLDTHLTGVGYYGLTASIDRDGRRLTLPLPGPIGEALEALKEASELGGMPAVGSVFRARGGPDRSLGYRGARKVLVRACRRAGLPPVASAELRAGCAYWLRSQGLSEHEVMMVLGLTRVRTVDRLLSRHQALDAQRRVREQLGER